MRYSDWLWVFAGSGMGGVFRLFLSRLGPPLSSTAFPWHTWLANVLASGLAAWWLLKSGDSNRETWRLLVVTGFCGGLSTFSTFSVESLDMIRNGHPGTALAYVGISVFSGLLVVWGIWKASGAI